MYIPSFEKLVSQNEVYQKNFDQFANESDVFNVFAQLYF